MEIGPIREGKPALSEQVEREKPIQAATVVEEDGDKVELSAEAQRFLAANDRQEEIAVGEGNEVEENKIRHQNRLDMIRGRIDTGYYDRETVRDLTIDKMIDDLLEDINSFYK